MQEADFQSLISDIKALVPYGRLSFPLKMTERPLSMANECLRGHYENSMDAFTDSIFFGPCR